MLLEVVLNVVCVAAGSLTGWTAYDIWQDHQDEKEQGGIVVPAPDPYANEPTQEIDRDKFKLWQEARANAKAWTEEAERLRGELEAAMGDAFAATVDGRKVLTYRPGSAYAVRAIQRDYPDLVQHFLVRKQTWELDIARFAAEHPDVVERYRVRSFRETGTDVD
jgi:hypothetical protein